MYKHIIHSLSFAPFFYASRCLSFLFGVVFFFFFFSENEYTLLFGYFFSRLHILFLSVTLTTVFEYIYIRSFNIAKYLVYEYHICGRQNFVSLKKTNKPLTVIISGYQTNTYKDKIHETVVNNMIHIPDIDQLDLSTRTHLLITNSNLQMYLSGVRVDSISVFSSVFLLSDLKVLLMFPIIYR